MKVLCAASFVVGISGCMVSSSADEAADAEAEAAPAQLAGKADGPSFVGLYANHATSHHDGDLTSLALEVVGANPSLATVQPYVRLRCYHDGCALRLPESDAYDTYTSTTGKTYVRFWSFDVVDDPAGRHAAPTIADVYEIRHVTGGIKLRKSYATRWVTLTTTTPAAQCSRSGGTWTTDACACAGIFVAGAGGCIANPGASETNCDATLGLWTDDEQTPIGTYCTCGLGRYDDPSGSCATI